MSSVHTQAARSLHPYGAAPGHYNPQYSRPLSLSTTQASAFTHISLHSPTSQPQPDRARWSPPSVDVNLPSWTTLIEEGSTSDEEDLLPDSQVSTAKLVGEQPTQQHLPVDMSEAHATPMTGLQAPAGFRSMHAQAAQARASSSTAEVNTHSTLKRARSSGSPPLLLTKKPRGNNSAIPLHMRHGLDRTSTISERDAPYPSSSAPNPADSQQPLAPTTPPSTKSQPCPLRRTFNSDARLLSRPLSSGTPVATASAPERPQRRAKALPTITEDSDVAEWKRVDDLLDTHVAPAFILSRYAQTPSLRLQAGGAQGLVHVPLRVDDFRQGSKGKRRAQPVRTETRWSNVGEFKERLDAMFGQGEITRGMGRAPKNVNKRAAHDGTAAVGPKVTLVGDQTSENDDAMGEEEEERLVGTARATGRGRLERRGL